MNLNIIDRLTEASGIRKINGRLKSLLFSRRPDSHEPKEKQ